MVVNNTTSSFTHNGVPVALGWLEVYKDRTSTVLAELFVRGVMVSNPVRLNQNGGIDDPIETNQDVVLCVVRNAVKAELFRYELVSGAGIVARWLPNTTTSEESIGIKDGAALAMVHSAKLNMSGSAKIEVHDGGSVSVKDSGSIDITGSGRLELDQSGSVSVKDGAKLNLHQGASIDLGNSAKLHAMGAGAISGLQGAIIENGTDLYANARVYKIKERYFSAQAGSQYDFDSFLVGDVFYFVADETLEGDGVNVGYYDTAENYRSEELKAGDSLTLILMDKKDSRLLFRKLSMVEENKPDSAPPFSIVRLVDDSMLNPEVNGMSYYPAGRFDKFTVEGPIPAIDVNIYPLRTLVCDKNGTLGLVTGFSSLSGGFWVVKTVSSSIGIFKGTRNQVLLGNGELSPLEGANGEKLNAASSLFVEGGVTNDAPDALCGVFQDKGMLIEWENIVDLVYNEVFDRLDESGFLGGGTAATFVNSVTLTISSVPNGQPISNEVSIVNNDPNYTVGTIVWTPDDEIANGTRAYSAVFTIAPKFGYQFHPAMKLLVNDRKPDSFEIQSDWSWLIKMNFPATMTELPNPDISIDEPAFGENMPSTATINDGGSYSVAIEWDTVSDTFPEGVSTGTFTLTANDGYRWNDSVVVLNGESYEGDLSDDGMTLVFEYEVRISNGLIEVLYLDDSQEKIGYADELSQLVYGSARLNGGIVVPMRNILGVTFRNDFSETAVPAGFLYNAAALAKPLTFPDSITSMGDQVLDMCWWFNQPLTLSKNLKNIGAWFLSNASQFNQPLTLPDSITSIGPGFLLNANNFNQPLTLPNSITSIGDRFLNAMAMQSTITWNTSALPPADPATDTSTSTGPTWYAPSLCYSAEVNSNSTTAPSPAPSLPSPTPALYNPGPTIAGTYASQLKSRLTNKSGTRVYRRTNNTTPADYTHIYIWRKLR